MHAKKSQLCVADSEDPANNDGAFLVASNGAGASTSYSETVESHGAVAAAGSSGDTDCDETFDETEVEPARMLERARFKILHLK